MKRLFFFVLWLLTALFGNAQTTIVSGRIMDKQSRGALMSTLITIEETTVSSHTDGEGFFEIKSTLNGAYVLKIEFPEYVHQRFPIVLGLDSLDLGVIFLEKDMISEQTDNLITLTDAEVGDYDTGWNSSGLLQATRDIFLNRAAFDFGQAFFRVRGYDSQNGKILLNGIPMNKLDNGRPQWNNWGGLNDVTRNQQFTQGLRPSEHNFGGILGTTNIDLRPTGLRPGTRFSSSISNRTYGGRVMATYTSTRNKKGLAYSISTSRRFAKQGYIEGTLYDSYSVFGSMEYQINEKHTVNLTALWATNRRGRSSALTEEVVDLVGKRYNPYWGEQNGKIRNTRERKIAEPILMFSHYVALSKFAFTTGIAYQWGRNARSRLAYFNAPNPDPTYYRYLPSYYVNGKIGANFESAKSARQGFLDSPQLNWNTIYTSNNAAKAAYIFYDDVVDTKRFVFNAVGNLEVGKATEIDFGGSYQHSDSENYAQIEDLLEADYHADIDAFSETLNDINGQVNKKKGDRYSYDYSMEISELEAFFQYRYSLRKWKVFLGLKYNDKSFQRDGKYQNERFLSNSLGRSSKVKFSGFGFKGGVTYSLNGRHVFVGNGAYLKRSPILQNSFINPRENNQVVPNLKNERITTTDFNYYLRLPKLTARITGFHSRFQNTTKINFFFVDAGVGSDFVQEVSTDLDKLHYGSEIGIQYQLSPAVQLSAVSALGWYGYASHPMVTINFDTAGAEDELINLEGSINLGRANIKDYRLAQGPQKAFALGVNYRDPKYWWIGASANYLASNYINISTITRTNSFYLDPDTDLPFPDATEENVAELLAQKPLDNFYLFNLVGGKSWLQKGKYISVFASVNNVFDVTFKTGGYEQSRNGNYGQMRQDNLSGSPSFAPKYWYGYGRTYFLNIAYSF